MFVCVVAVHYVLYWLLCIPIFHIRNLAGSCRQAQGHLRRYYLQLCRKHSHMAMMILFILRMIKCFISPRDLAAPTRRAQAGLSVEELCKVNMNWQKL
jgi:hypothetical protein